MGNLINNNMNYLNKQAKKGLEIIEDTTFSRFLETAPVPVTYFRQNKVETTTDSGFGTVETNIGLSGKKFNKIYGVPMFAIDPNSFNLDVDDMGIRGSFQSECVMIPDVLEPITEDYFTLEYQDNRFLFKITNVEYDKIKSNNYFKVSFKYDREMLPQLEKQVVDEYTCIFENIGTDEKTIIKNEKVVDLKQLKSLYDIIRNAYLDNFHNTMASTLTFEENGLYFYDPYLVEFVMRTEIFVDDSFSSLSFRHLMPVENDFRSRYLKSIFYGIENGSFTLEDKVRFSRIRDVMTYFYRSGKPYYTTQIRLNELEESFPYKHTNEFDYFYKGTDNLLNTILLYKNNDDNVQNHIIENLKDFDCLYNRDYFICVPIVLFIIKNIMNNITINKII